MLLIDIEKKLKNLDTNYEALLQIIESSTFEIKNWEADVEFVMDDLVKYNGNLYICCVDSSNKSAFDNNDFNQITNMSDNDIKELIESYFYKEDYLVWVKVDTEEAGVTKTVVSNDTTPTDDEVTVNTVIGDIPDIQVGDFVKQIAGDTSIYRRKDDSYSLAEINEIVEELKKLIDDNSHTHVYLTDQEILDLIGVGDGSLDFSLIDDNSTVRDKTWSSYQIDRKMKAIEKVASGIVGMKKLVVDTKPTGSDIDPNTMYFVKRIEGTDVVYDVTVFLDESDTEGIILNSTTIQIDGDEVATKTFIENTYAKKEDLADIAYSGEFADLKNLPSGLVNVIPITQTNFDKLTNTEKEALQNGLPKMYFIIQE